MTDFLAHDLLLEILLRVPVRSLLRFRCVSKSWCSLITSSNFINSHINHQNKHNNPLLLIRSYNEIEKKLSYKLCQDSEAMEEILSINLPFVSQNQIFRLLGCVNGLLCLIDDIIVQTDHIVLWNPVIRRSLTLPKPQIAFDSNHFTAIYGFGCGLLSNDYKIIRILCPKDSSGVKSTEPATEIFRLSKGFWENLEGCGSLPMLDSRHAYLNGVVHWLAYSHLILAFDTDTEALRVVNLPIALQWLPVQQLIVASWRDTLSVFQMQDLGDFSLWVMQEYGVEGSWNKRFTVRSFGVPRSIRSLRKNGEVILVEDGNKLVLYDPAVNQIRNFTVKVEGTMRVFHMKSYMESLVLLDRLDAVHV